MLRPVYCLIAWFIVFGCAKEQTPFQIEAPSDGTTSVSSEPDDTNSSLSTDETPPPATDSAELKETDSNLLRETDTGAEPTDVETESTGPFDTDTAAMPTDTGMDSEIPNRIPGTQGEPCWIPVLSANHPNAGLLDCTEGFKCIGDSDEAWCTVTCNQTGTVSNNLEITGWCCGEIGNPCSPSRFYMPSSMSVNCAPRILSLGAPCETSGAERCAPTCLDGEIIENPVCVQIQSGGFCSYPCAAHTDCTDNPAFSTGCCGAAMGNTYCMPPSAADRCL